MTFLFKIASDHPIFSLELFIGKEAAVVFIIFFILIVYGGWILWRRKRR